MKNKLLAISLMVVSAGIISCKGPEKSPEANQPAKTEVAVSDAESRPAEPAAISQAPAPAPAPATESAKKEATKEGKTGNEIINDTSGRLGRKLGLVEPATSKVTAILKEAFYTIGGKADVMYPAEEAKELGTKIVKNSEMPIMALLNPEQQANFKKFLAK